MKKLHFSKMKEFQDILYSYPINKEKLTKQIENLRTICSNEEIDRELIFAFSLDYQKIPILIPFLSKKSLEKNQFIHFDQEFLTILMKNGIDFPVQDILFFEEYEEEKKVRRKVLEEELVIELEKKGVEFDKTNVIIREKSQLEKAIEEDDVETLILLSNQTNFDLNQRNQKENQLYEYTAIPIILFCIQKHAMKCFKFLLINGANPLETIIDFPSWKKKNIDGMTFGAETGNLQIMQMIEEKGGKIDKNCIIGAAKFHQNHILKWILQQKQEEEELILGLCSSAEYNNFEGVSLFLENRINVNARNIIYENSNFLL